MDIFLVVSIAFIIAILFSMLGLGGAIIYTPLFFWMGLPILTANPMGLLLNAITTASASINYLKQQFVRKEFAYPMGIASIFGALAGAYLAQKIEPKVLVLFLSVVLLFAGIRMLFFSNIGMSFKIDENKKMILGSSASFLIGVISSIVGIGGGTFIVPLLIILGFEIKNAVATSAFIITFMTFSGFIGHLIFGSLSLDLRILFYAGTAAFIGAQIGSRIIFRRVSSITINRLFAIVLLFSVCKLLYGLI